MNDSIIAQILNSIVNGLLEALKPRIDEIVAEKIKSLPDPLNGSYVTAEEFREFEARVKELEETKVDQGELEDKVDSAVAEIDLDDKVSDALDNYDLSDKVNDCIADYDFSSIVGEEISNQDLCDADAVRNIVRSELSDLRIVQG